MSRRAARTGPGAMFPVAIEQGFAPEKRILTDDLAGPILPLESRLWLWLLRPLDGWLVRTMEAKAPGLWGGIMARKRYIDDLVASAARSLEAVVNLGAGFDTRALRLPELAAIPVWEVDQPSNIEAKRRRLESILGEVPDHVMLVPVDFDHEDLDSTLRAHGYPAFARTFFIWEGVTQYLSEDGFLSTLEFLKGAAPGSRLVFTYVPSDFIDGTRLYGQPHLHKKMLGRKPIWHFGLDPDEVDEVLGRIGWQVEEHLGYDELAERYVKPTGRDLSWMAIERIVSASKE